jgi:hypothetical protein
MVDICIKRISSTILTESGLGDALSPSPSMIDATAVQKHGIFMRLNPSRCTRPATDHIVSHQNA